MHFCFAKHKALVVLQMGVFNVMNALTEQTVFVFMLLHRVWPQVLRRCPWLGFVLTVCYAGTRVVFGSLALRAWYGFATDAALQSARTELYGSIVLVTYPLLTLIQMATQWECFMVQLGLSARYWSSNDSCTNEEARVVKKISRCDSSSSTSSSDDELMPALLFPHPAISRRTRNRCFSA
ncbi:hypothetical protein PINS_up024001 [Pythium insidiosum]|nr:hypothetical protein PINS_up024001 [Pythium insidiosum]